MDIDLDFAWGADFACPRCGGLCKAYDTTVMTWRHMDFFAHRTFLHARTPRTDCEKCGPLRVEVPWARAGSGFTLLFEAMAISLAAQMPVAAVARHVRENVTVIWRMVNGYVDKIRVWMF